MRPRGIRRCLGLILAATVFILFANLLTLVVGIAPNLDTRIVDIGEVMWPGYAAELRQDPAVPDCDLAALKERLATCPADGGAPAAPPRRPVRRRRPVRGSGRVPETRPCRGAGPSSGRPVRRHRSVRGSRGTPEARSPPHPRRPIRSAAPIRSRIRQRSPRRLRSRSRSGPGVRGWRSVRGSGSGSGAADDPFAPSAPSAAVNCPALRSLHDQCAIRHQEYDHTVARLTSGIRSFRTFELAISDVAKFAFWKHLLVLVVVFGGISATATRVHVALRNPRTVGEHRARQIAELAAHLFWLVSCIADWQVQRASTAEIDNASLPVLWACGFVVLAAIERLPPGPSAPRSGGRTHERRAGADVHPAVRVPRDRRRAVLQRHRAALVGQAIYLHKFVAYPNVYLGIALYVWAGMLLSETRVAPRVFDVFRRSRCRPTSSAGSWR